MIARAFSIAAVAIAVLILGLPAWSAQSDWPETLTLVTASPGGTYQAVDEIGSG